jgi:hypothetical protein
MKSRLATAAAGAFVLAVASPAAATIFIDAAPPFPTNPEETIQLNGGGSPAPQVQGVTNQSGALINFLGTENLTAPSQGQARIEAADGAFTFLDIRPDDPTVGFSALEFNLDALADGGVTFTLFDQNNTPFVFNETLDANGSNFFNFTTADEMIIRAVISASVELGDLSQARVTLNDVEGGGPGGGAVPEPATWAMMILGFFGAGAVLRNRRRLLTQVEVA